MSIIDHILNLIAPHDCISCGREGLLLCSLCAGALLDPQPECYFCRQPTRASSTCRDCYARAQLVQVIVGTLYDGTAKQLVQRFKYGGAQAAAQTIVAALPTISANGLVVIPVPTASSRVRRRGYDQAALLAKAFARKHDLEYLPCLRRTGQSHQVGASRSERLLQLAQAFRVVHASRLRGKRVLLVDDVITTGATFEAAARVLHAAGAVQVSALAFARGL